MISSVSGINLFGTSTRTFFTGGNRSYPTSYETRPVPEIRMILPFEDATSFSTVLQKTIDKFKRGEHDPSLNYSESSG